MATTCKLIAKTTLGSDTASVTFGSGGTIPQTYTDLLIVCSARTSRSGAGNNGDGIKARFNGETSDAIHSTRILFGNGSTAGSITITNFRVGFATSEANTTSTFGSSECYIPNYAGSTKKSASATATEENNATASAIGAYAALWDSTSAITAIELTPQIGANFKSGSSFFLYGITKA